MNQSPTGMPCPSCKTNLVMSDRQGIEIDYCPSCRGVWLDRGELDKIIERNNAAQGAAAPQAHVQPAPQYQQPHPQQYYSNDKRHYKRKSWLEEIFD